MLTQLTTLLGLIPLVLAAEPLWRSFTIAVVGGLIAGTLISLGLLPAVYALMFRIQPYRESLEHVGGHVKPARTEGTNVQA